VFDQFSAIADKSSVPVVLCKAELSKVPSLQAKFKVEGTPTFLFLQNGVKVVDKLPKADIKQLKAAFKKHVKVSLEDIIKEASSTI
jgi:protein-disulfide isomerase